VVKPLIYIQEPWGSGARRLFSSFGYDFVDTPEKCDVIVFNGGEDLHPKLYKQTIIPRAQVTWLDEERDAIEVAGYERAKEKFKFGICRGGQLLNVMNGGTLWQDVDNHGRAHDMIDLETGETIFTSSVHHQQFITGPEVKILAEANISDHKIGYIGKEVSWVRGHGANRFEKDPEVVFYPKDRALCIQGHPEYGGYTQFTNWCMKKLEELY